MPQNPFLFRRTVRFVGDTQISVHQLARHKERSTIGLAHGQVVPYPVHPARIGAQLAGPGAKLIQFDLHHHAAMARRLVARAFNGLLQQPCNLRLALAVRIALPDNVGAATIIGAQMAWHRNFVGQHLQPGVKGRCRQG